MSDHGVSPEPWPVGWIEHRSDQLARMLAATPAQRLAWLEDAIAFACRAGALPAAPDGTAMGRAPLVRREHDGEHRPPPGSL